ncbi:MAG: ATP-binding protein [Myxococcota bacterium]|nr:ATP-binding protein [Myxococcota bacterium]
MRISLPGKIFAGFVALMLTFGGVMVYTAWGIRELGTTLTRLHTSLVPLPSMVAEVKSDLRRLSLVAGLNERNSLLRAVDQLQKVDQTPTRLAQRLDKMRARLERRDGSPEADALLAHFQLLETEYRAMNAQLSTFFKALEEGDDITVFRRPTRRSIAKVARQVEFFGLETNRALGRTIDVFEQDEDQLAWGAIFLATVATLLGLLITFLATRLLKPLRALREGVERVADGRYDTPVLTKANDELGLLATEFNRMAEAIRRRDEKLNEQQKTLLQREQLATVGRMSAQITHELRNPLSSIGLNSELMMEELAASEQTRSVDNARELLMSITREVDRLKEITEEYLRFARLPMPEKSLVDLNHTAAELIDFFRSEMEQADVKMRLDPDPVPKAVEVDPNQVRAALINLIRNAKEAMTSGGHIVLRIRRVGDVVYVEVTDTGGGIQVDTQERLFEPFYSTKPQGTGLGLSMVKQIVDAHDGVIRVESSPGQGTTFRLSFPTRISDQNGDS